MGLFRSREILGIAGETLEFALTASEQTHPNEYMGFLRADEASTLGLDRDGQVITDVVIVPGTESGPTSAKVQTMYQPTDVQSVGSVHSHPNGVLRPSDADLATFTRGEVHIIIGAPYGRGDWQAFDSDGYERELDIVDVDLSDEEFFDITQAEIDPELRAEQDTAQQDDDPEDDGGFLSWLR
jgi:proteasome lid subunit RPN8/RPN11